MLHAADASLQVLQEADSRYSGHVVCGLTPSVGKLMIPQYVQRFRRELPGATLTIFPLLSVTLHQQLRASRLDFAILHEASASPGLDITPLCEQSLFVFGTYPLGEHADRVSIRALKNIPLVMPSEAHAVRKTVEVAAARAGVSLDIRFEVDAFDAILELVKQGVGHTISTGVATTGLSPGLALQEITTPRLRSELSLVTPLQRNLTPLQSKAAELARETFMALHEVAQKKGRGARHDGSVRPQTP